MWERVSKYPPAGVRHIYVAMWDCTRGGGREGEGEGEGEEGWGEEGRITDLQSSI